MAHPLPSDPPPKPFERLLFAQDLAASLKALCGPRKLFADIESIPAPLWMCPIHSRKARFPGSPAFRVFLERAFSPRDSEEALLWTRIARAAFQSVRSSPWAEDLPARLPWRVFSLLGPACIFVWAGDRPDSSEALNRLDCEGRDLLESGLISRLGYPHVRMPEELALRTAIALGYDISGRGKEDSRIHPLYQTVRDYRDDLVPLLLELGADPRQKILMEDDSCGRRFHGQRASVLELAGGMLEQSWLSGAIRERVERSLAILRSRAEALDLERAAAPAAASPPVRSGL